MKRTTTIALVAAIAITMTGCDALDAVLGYNMFSSLAAVDAKEISEADAETLVELSDSDSFYDTLEDDTALKDTTLTKIDNAILSADPTTSNCHELAALAANIELQTTAAGDLINNVSGLIGDIIDGTLASGEITDIKAVVESLVPASVHNPDGSINETVFVDMINALVAADQYYQLIGNNIANTATYKDEVDFVVGEIAQNAILAALVASVGTGSYATTGDYLYSILEEGETPPSYTFHNLETGYLDSILDAAEFTFNI